MIADTKGGGIASRIFRHELGVPHIPVKEGRKVFFFFANFFSFFNRSKTTNYNREHSQCTHEMETSNVRLETDTQFERIHQSKYFPQPKVK